MMRRINYFEGGRGRTLLEVEEEEEEDGVVVLLRGTSKTLGEIKKKTPNNRSIDQYCLSQKK